jgi:hypothetical protein
MNKGYSIVAGFVFFLTTITCAQQSNFQLGVVLNGPTGIALKIWTISEHAIDAAVSWDLTEDYQTIYFHTDYLLHYSDIFTVDGGKLPLYWGFGLRGDGDVLDNWAVRIPLGACYIYGESVFDIFFEVAPLLNFYRDIQFTIMGAVGFRMFL